MRGKRLKSEGKKSYHESELEFGFPSRSEKGQINQGNQEDKALSSPRQEIKSNQGSSAKRRVQASAEKPREIVFYEELKSDNETLPIQVTEDRQSFSGSEDEKELATRLEERRESYQSGTRQGIRPAGGARGSVEEERNSERMLRGSANERFHYSRESTQEMRIVSERQDITREITPIIETRLL